MYGLIAKVTVVSGRRGELVEILADCSAQMPGCLSYVIAEDLTDENVVWVTEAWDSEASHRACVNLPSVQKAITAARPIIAGFARIATTNPIRGIG
jgi:quinol monooxygenase YgiN